MGVDQLMDKLFDVSPVVVYSLVTLLVFAEDAIFVGFVIPGETAAVIGGVIANQGHTNIYLTTALVVLAAIVGDSVGFEIGRWVGPRILEMKILARHRGNLENAQGFLRRRGGWAVFLGRFIAFFRAVMPALAGISRMRYPKFLSFNALGGLVWGVGFTLLGYFAADSYQRLEKTVGRAAAIAVAVVVVVGLIAWRVVKHRRDKQREPRGGQQEPQ